MAQKAKKSTMKDLDPKGRGKLVKGGVLCCVLGAAGLALRYVDSGKRTASKAVDPR